MPHLYVIEQSQMDGMNMHSINKVNLKNFGLSLLLCIALSAFTVNADTLSIIGDSYSTYGNKISDYYPAVAIREGNNVATYEDTWKSIFISKSGLELTYCDALLGSMISGDAQDASAIVNRVKATKENLSDVIIVMGGLNDYWSKKKVGILDDVDLNQTDFAPALYMTLSELKNRNKTATIIYSLILYDRNIDEHEYDMAARHICEALDVTYVPISEIPCISWHPTKTGMQKIADTLFASLYADEALHFNFVISRRVVQNEYASF